MLSKYEIAWHCTGPLSITGRVIEYRVQGSSPNDEVFIADFGSWQRSVWMVLRVKDTGGWTGRYATAEDAFASLSA